MRLQIDLDVPRTFVQMDCDLREDDGAPSGQSALQISLRKILLCYALHMPSVGYCQGMAVIAGVALSPDVKRSRSVSFAWYHDTQSTPSLNDEEGAFWWLHFCITVLLVKDTFSPGLYGLQIEQGVLLRLLRQVRFDGSPCCTVEHKV